jgi:hypothetical protein
VAVPPNAFHCISSNVPVVTAAVCGRAFSWRRRFSLIDLVVLNERLALFGL